MLVVQINQRSWFGWDDRANVHLKTSKAALREVSIAAAKASATSELGSISPFKEEQRTGTEG